MHCPECYEKIESESILCPRCGVKSDFPASTERVCDIYLMGFQDPSAHDQVIDHLFQRSFWKSRDDLMTRLSSLPALVAKGMESERAHFFRDEMEKMGGIIEMRERKMRGRGTAKKIIDEEDVIPSGPAVPTRGGKGYFILFLLSLGAVFYLAYHHDFSEERETVQRAVKKITSRIPKAASRDKNPEHSVEQAERVSATGAMDTEGVRLNNQGVAFMDQGSYEEAVQFFLEALALIPGDKTIMKNMHRAWLQKGYRHLESKEYEKSIVAFEEAIKVSDESPEVYKLMGMAALNMSDEEAAIQYFLSYLGHVPDDPEVARTVGEIFYKENKLEEGVRYLKIYYASNPDDTSVLEMLEKAGRELVAEEGFDVHEGTHFDVHFDGMENLEAGYFITENLENAYQRIGAELNIYPEERLVTILYSDEDFRNVTQAPDWTRGLYDGKIRIPIGGLKEKNQTLERVVNHEYTHALVHQVTGGNVPTWLNEGLAQYFEGEPALAHSRTAQYILKSKDFLPPEKLEGSFMRLDADTAAMAYTQSYTMVDLIIQENGIYAIQKLLTELGDGADVESALINSVGEDYPALQGRWLKYLARNYP